MPLGRAKVVIGANWGDEGKGLMTDYFSNEGSIVVRFNGGAQAGHTVVTPYGQRHVFHHFGSGSFEGAHTLLSNHFISNPILFHNEYESLKTHHLLKPLVAVDDRSIVSTHYDMMINQMIEEMRNSMRHGSCGIGINETIKRNEHNDFKITMRDLRVWSESYLREKLLDIQKRWVSHRVLELECLDIPDEWKLRLSSSEILNIFLEKARFYVDKTITATDLLRDHKNDNDFIFEGAQGLLLDEDHYFFPHVTHSHTGLKNVIEISKENKIRKLDVTYVTRAYATRHGVGPFPGENHHLRYEDNTNVINDWQGSLRFGYLNIDLLSESISNDIQKYSRSTDINFNIAITCMDQISDEVSVIFDNNILNLKKENLLELISERLLIPVKYISYGPTRNTILQT